MIWFFEGSLATEGKFYLSLSSPGLLEQKDFLFSSGCPQEELLASRCPGLHSLLPSLLQKKVDTSGRKGHPSARGEQLHYYRKYPEYH